MLKMYKPVLFLLIYSVGGGGGSFSCMNDPVILSGIIMQKLHAPGWFFFMYK